MAYYQSRTKHELPEEGKHKAVICDMVDKGYVETEWGKKQRGYYSLQLEQRHSQTGKRLLVHIPFNFTGLHPKGSDTKIIEAVLDRKLTDEEAAKFDMELIRGLTVEVRIDHVLHNGKTYANVARITPVRKGDEPLEIEDFTRNKDREDSDDVRGHRGDDEDETDGDDEDESDGDNMPF